MTDTASWRNVEAAAAAPPGSLLCPAASPSRKERSYQLNVLGAGFIPEPVASALDGIEPRLKRLSRQVLRLGQVLRLWQVLPLGQVLRRKASAPSRGCALPANPHSPGTKVWIGLPMSARDGSAGQSACE